MRRSVRFRAELPELTLVDRSIGPFFSNDEAEVWEWDAEVLEKHGFAAPAGQLSVQDLRKMILLQERNSGPIALPDGFYREINSRINSLRMAGDARGADELRSALMTFIEIRLPKILLLSLSPDITVKLPPEEALLVNRLAHEIEEWSRIVVKEKIGEEGAEHGTGGTVSRDTGNKGDLQE